MEEERKRKNAEQIDDKDYILNFGHFLPLSVVRSLNVSKKIDLFAMDEDGFDFSPADLLFTLAYTKILRLLSEEETNPAMYGVSTFTDEEMLGGLEFLGSCYQEIMEVMNDSLGHIHKRKMKRCFFNYSDFYLKNELQHRELMLLLDSESIPMWMERKKENQNTSADISEFIKDAKGNLRSPIRVIEVLNESSLKSANIVDVINRKDGYIFLKSNKSASEEELTWALPDDKWTNHLDKNGYLRYCTRFRIVKKEYSYKSQEGKTMRVSVPEKQVVMYKPSRTLGLEMGIFNNAPLFNKYQFLSTSETDMTDEEIYESYLQGMDTIQAFQDMDTEYSAEPNFMSRTDFVNGNLLSSYVAVMLVRVIQNCLFKSIYTPEEIVDYLQKFKVLDRQDGTYINLMRRSEATIGEELNESFSLPTLNRFIDGKDRKDLFSFTFSSQDLK